jgi:hypothetical protein
MGKLFKEWINIIRLSIFGKNKRVKSASRYLITLDKIRICHEVTWLTILHYLNVNICNYHTLQV